MSPSLPVLLCVLSGIVAARCGGIGLATWWGLLGTALLVSCVRPCRLCGVFLFFFCLSGLRFQAAAGSGHSLSTLLHGPAVVQALIQQETQPDSRAFRARARLVKIHVGEKWRRADTEVILVSAHPLPPASIVTTKGEFRFSAGIPVFRTRTILMLRPDPNPLRRFFEKERGAMERWLRGSVMQPYGAVAIAILLGDHGAIPPRVLEWFRVTGTYHLLVASGLKVALAAGAAWSLLFMLNFFPRLFASAGAVLVYAFLVGGEIPLLRASFMELWVIAAFLIGRGKESLNALSLAAILLLLWNPTSLFTPAFQLSFLSVLGILVFCDPIVKRLKFLPRWIAASVAVTVSAMIPVITPMAYYFHIVSFISPLANLFAVPLSAASMLLGTTGFLTSLVAPAMARALSFWHQAVLAVLLKLVEVCSRAPLAYLCVPSPHPPTVLLSYLFLAGLWLVLSHRRGGMPVVAGSLAALLALWIGHALAPAPSGIAFVNVGQGDCTVIAIQRKTFLVDGGGSPSEIDPDGFSVGEKIVVPFLESQGVNQIDGILLTHPHTDHVGGLIAVLEHFRVKQIWLPKLSCGTAVYKRFLSEARKKRVPLVFIHGREKIRLAQGAWLHVCWPIPPFLYHTVSDLNNNSVVSRLSIGKLHVLLAGDVELAGEAGLLNRYRPQSSLWSQILKVPHHGSATSSTREFLRPVSPVIAVVSVGKHNPYHQPSAATLQRLKKCGAMLFRTDQDGTVAFRFVSTGLRPRIQPVPQSIPH